MCYNAAKTYKLGWFKEYHVNLGGNAISWSGDLVGFAERDALPNGSSDKMIIRISSSDQSGDYYVHFNRKVGFNDGTREGADQVMVVTRTPGLSYAHSWLVGKLNTGMQHVVANFQGSGKPLTVTVNNIDGGTPRRATRHIPVTMGHVPATMG